MDLKELKQIINNEISINANNNMFGVSPIPAHTHNGTDSLPVSFGDLTNRVGAFAFTIPGASAATTTNYSVFFIAPYPVRLIGIQEAHTTAGTDGGAVTLNIEKLTGTTAPGAGTSLLSTAFDLKGTANTVLTAPSSAYPLTTTNQVSSLNLATGDRLAFKLTGTPTSVANVTVTLQLAF